MKRLTLVRHAKSSWKDPSLEDFDRPLSGRGKQDAPEMGRRLADRGVRPDALVTSPAKRARKTARKIASEIGFPEDEIREEPRIYEADGGTLLRVVRDLDPLWKDVLLVGHNPGLSELLDLLVGADPQRGDLPTAAAAEILLPGPSWAEVEVGQGRLVRLDRPERDGS